MPNVPRIAPFPAAPRQSRLRRSALTTAVTVLIAASSAAAADAATVTLVNDNGIPAPLAQGEPAAIRNMNTSVAVLFPAADSNFNLVISGPDGTAVSSPISCNSTSVPVNTGINYIGNGTYTVVLTNFAGTDPTCATPTTTETYTFTINASVALAAPGAPFLLRERLRFPEPDSDDVAADFNELALRVAINPGADGYEVVYARNRLGPVILDPEGGISRGGGNVIYSTRKITGGKARLFGSSDYKPAAYTVVARAFRTSGGGEFSTPWSAPVQVTAKVPFDFKSLTLGRSPLYFPTSNRFRLRGVLGSRDISGRLYVRYTRGCGGAVEGSRLRITRGEFTTALRLFGTQYSRRTEVRFLFPGSPIAPAQTSRFRFSRPGAKPCRIPFGDRRID